MTHFSFQILDKEQDLTQFPIRELLYVGRNDLMKLNKQAYK